MNRLSSLGSSDPQQSTESQHSHPTNQTHPGPRPQPPATLPHLSPTIDRPRRFFLPASYEPNYRYPLIVWLHGNGHNENEVTQVMPHISIQNYLAVGVRGSRSIDPAGHRFDWATSPAAVARCEDGIFQAIDEASERYSVHPDRVFLAGYGAGGTMARRIALRHADAFAGCVSLGGRFPRGGGLLSNLAVARTLDHFWALGIDNPQVSADDFASDLELISTARLRMDIRRYTVDDEMVREVLRDVDAWVMRLVTGGQAAGGAAAIDKWKTVEVGFSAN